jgi:hypothetical protein
MHKTQNTLYIVNNYSDEYINRKGSSFDYLMRYAIHSSLKFSRVVVLKPTQEHIAKLLNTIRDIHATEPSAVVRILLSGSDYNVDSDARDQRSKDVLDANLELCRTAEADPRVRLFGICYGAQVVLVHGGMKPVVHSTSCKGYYQICRTPPTPTTEPLTVLTVWANYSRVFDVGEGSDIDVSHVYCTGVGKTNDVQYCQHVQVFTTNQNIMGTAFHPERLLTTHFFLNDFFE